MEAGAIADAVSSVIPSNVIALVFLVVLMAFALMGYLVYQTSMQMKDLTEEVRSVAKNIHDAVGEIKTVLIAALTSQREVTNSG